MTLLTLAESTGCKPHRLAGILGQEVQAGRVLHEAGTYRLVPEAFPAEVVEALRNLSAS